MSKAGPLATILSQAPVIPVIQIEDVANAVPLARALLAGGVRVLEVTLRTEAAFEAIRRIQAEVPEAIVGAGTVLTPDQLDAVANLEAAFAVSPGATPALLDAAAGSPVPLLPGTTTASDVMAVLERGYTHMKLFPAEAVGGAALLSSLAAPLPTARFCPTGGIDQEKAKRYLALPNVVCVGGSWLTPRDAIRQSDWNRITELARTTLSLREQNPQ
ncbi:bifunctional 4-hydroxy-2-oxoglutarate aldolase/2-dehydro-3-deoxy-phosphogluconate aldolase [Microvirga lotononidis]|uniref:2-dehydro-3-deoxy-phosphogluconate aldolase n=1 Tax=Microvirga lotononidis TaxID=864069 RepID=I4YQZ9_9HYPH|nr:bifunctional 4-hydroxy-2-oxoglutarate aldolase/2-dehydro-3-deoxy-phosphogluconate aldolase [Microvirga lotononidis]EIM26391.1 Entner-Doudoroff aldolase [Microvirga lotononidis]WQO30755.1 bifunctional 4-hydroxy-2-oxoglutarate aldolase/2-dehydro-3-deoxy-phosphogluconate aldolase [Microvirga lotononidis]